MAKTKSSLKKSKIPNRREVGKLDLMMNLAIVSYSPSKSRADMDDYVPTFSCSAPFKSVKKALSKYHLDSVKYAFSEHEDSLGSVLESIMAKGPEYEDLVGDVLGFMICAEEAGQYKLNSASGRKNMALAENYLFRLVQNQTKNRKNPIFSETMSELEELYPSVFKYINGKK